jgi:hypothetical protein
MRLNDIIVEDLEEGVLGGLSGLVKNLTAPIKGYQAGDARSSGAGQTKARATALYKNFFNQVGQSGQKATGRALIDYLTKKQYPIRQAKAIIDAAPVPKRKPNPNPNPTDIDADWDRLATGTNEDIQNTDEARGYYDVELSADTAWKAILAAEQENLRMNRATMASSSPASGGGNIGNVANMRSGTSSSTSSAAGGGITAETIMQWFESQNQATRANLVTALNLKHEVLNKKSATATPTAEGWSRFLGRDL